MALIVEDGTGKVDAESYASVAEFKAYCAKFGLTVPADDTAIEINLRKATRYMVTLYRGYLAGLRTVANQALDFPRTDLWRDDYDEVDPHTVPAEAKETCILLAKVAETAELMPTLVGRTKKSVKIGPLSVEYDGDGPTANAFINAVRGMAVFVASNGGGFSVNVVRT